MSDSGDQDYVMGYKCPSCGAVGGHTRTTFGPEGDARNLERYCRNCNKKFIITETEYVNNIEESEGGYSSPSSQDTDRNSADGSSQNNAMTNAQEQLTELLSLKESKTWDDFRLYEECERNGQLTLSISRELDGDGYTDVESSLIQNICHVFDTEEYEVTVVTCENARELYIKFYGVSVEAPEIYSEGDSRADGE